MSEIPSELLHEILRRVPAESLLRFRAVCKSWRRIVDDPSFIRSHANNQTSSTTLFIRNSTGTRFCSLALDSLNYDDAHQTIDVTPVKSLYASGQPRLPVLPVASCNGIILQSYYDIEMTWVLWNPLTREFRELPNPKFDADSFSVIGSGIGYDTASDDYKVVRIDQLLRHDRTVYQTSVYSLKVGSWRIIKDCPYELFWSKPRNGVFLNGALHWISQNVIVALVLETEEYRELPLPLNSGEPFVKHLDVLGGCLVLSYKFEPMNVCQLMDGWVMKDYGVEKSWTKLFSFSEVEGIIGIMGDLRPIAYIESKGLVILHLDNKFLCLHIESNSAKKVIIHGLTHKFSCQILPGSLFRLGDSCAVAAKRRAGVKRKRKRNKADARVKHSVNITDAWSR